MSIRYRPDLRVILHKNLKALQDRLKQFDQAREADSDRAYMNDITADFMQETIEMFETLFEAVDNN